MRTRHVKVELKNVLKEGVQKVQYFFFSFFGTKTLNLLNK